MRRALLTLVVAASILGGLPTNFQAAQARPLDPAVDRGWDLAQHRCVECHAVRPGRESSEGAAPPFRVLQLRYNEISLAKRIFAVSQGEHAGMPPMALTEAERQDLVAYIESLDPEGS